MRSNRDEGETRFLFPDIPAHEPHAAAADNHNEWTSEDRIVSRIMESRTLMGFTKLCTQKYQLTIQQL